MSFDLSGIQNVGEFYSHHYLDAVLSGDLKEVFRSWQNQKKETGRATPDERFQRLESEFFKARHQASEEFDELERWRLARSFHAKLLEALGYPYEPGIELLADGETLPVLLSQNRDGSPFLWVIDAPFCLAEDESALDTKPLLEQYPEDSRPDEEPELTWKELLDKPIFRQDRPPRWVIFLAGDEILLIDGYKWGQGKYLRFDLLDLLSRQNRNALRATAALLHRSTLNPDDGISYHDRLEEANHKHAYAVSADLKFGAREAIELLGNEAIYYIREVQRQAVFSNEEIANQITDECLTYLYRLLFLFYVEARGPELGIAPMNAEAFREGYSLETLRDLELVPLTTTEAQEGYYINHSLEMLFELIQNGFPRQETTDDATGQLILSEEKLQYNSFFMKGLHTPLFDPAKTPLLRGVKFRNSVLQQVICLLSLSREGKRKDRGRISYAQLGINQLGSVYEGLLSYSGFFATDDLFEVRAAKDIDDEEARTFFVSESDSEIFDEKEFVKDNGRRRTHPKGSYLFRLSGREREKSASFYTPEVLTKCLVKYTLKERLEGLSADEILKLTLCEPAMGSGAFLNEAIDQLAHAYLEKKQEETGKTIPSDDYTDEWLKTKYHFTCHNSYGVDKNPRALELAKLSLWLNTLSPNVETPYLDLRLASGDSLIGARRMVYKRSKLTKKKSKKNPNWQDLTPERVTRAGEGEVYHFLLPADGMASFEKDKAVKALVPDELKKMKAWNKEMAEPFADSECDTLERISRQIDELWDQHAKERRSILDEIRQPVDLWGQEQTTNNKRGYSVDQAQETASRLTRGSAAGTRLKAIMDYWCALWFWPLDKADDLPTRDEWLMEINGLLSSDVHQLTEGFERFQIIQEITQRTNFVHWELLFAEVFAERGGFDVIVGNPPWVKLEWKEGGVLGDLAPELMVKKISASNVAKRRAEVLESERARKAYFGEYQEMIGSAQFLNSTANYPLLAKQQTNLYKCFLVFNWHLLNKSGMQGLIHEPGVFNDPKGGKLREEFSQRLKWYAQFQNKLQLFEGVQSTRIYCFTISSGVRSSPRFRLIANLFHPRTLEESVKHDGFGTVPGIKDDNDNWDFRGHRSRIVEVDDQALTLFATLYDSPGTPSLEARIPVVHSREILEVLRKFAMVERRLGDLGEEYYSTVCFDETNQQKDGTIRRETCFPKNVNEWIMSGPHLYVGTPFYKCPWEVCGFHRDYDVIDHTTMSDDYLPRTNYVRDCKPDEFIRRLPHWHGKPVTKFYRYIHRRRVAPTGERTLIPAIIPPGAQHVNTCISFHFNKFQDLLLVSALASTLVSDFFYKTTGKGDIYGEDFAVQVHPVLSTDLLSLLNVRTLRLNCLTTHYADLWSECWDEAFAGDSFTKDDLRLSSWSHLTPTWHRDSAVRTPFERRQCLVELDALAALALNLTSEELCTIYRVQFPVMRMFERGTFYDQRGMIVRTPNAHGLPGVGLKTQEWEEIKNAEPGDPLPEHAEQYIPPFTRCDREEDMTLAYNVFKERLAKKEQLV